MHALRDADSFLINALLDQNHEPPATAEIIRRCIHRHLHAPKTTPTTASAHGYICLQTSTNPGSVSRPRSNTDFLPKPLPLRPRAAPPTASVSEFFVGHHHAQCVTRGHHQRVVHERQRFTHNWCVIHLLQPGKAVELALETEFGGGREVKITTGVVHDSPDHELCFPYALRRQGQRRTQDLKRAGICWDKTKFSESSSAGAGGDEEAEDEMKRGDHNFEKYVDHGKTGINLRPLKRRVKCWRTRVPRHDTPFLSEQHVTLWLLTKSNPPHLRKPPDNWGKTRSVEDKRSRRMDGGPPTKDRNTGSIGDNGVLMLPLFRIKHLYRMNKEELRKLFEAHMWWLCTSLGRKTLMEKISLSYSSTVLSNNKGLDMLGIGGPYSTHLVQGLGTQQRATADK
ncbi:hypothetical protein LXL04_020272 [Taraxacum kok-saghyz]